MAENTIDTLDIQISSSTAKAVRSLENLSKKLISVNQALKNVNTGGLRNYARDMGRVSASIKSLNGIKVAIPNLSGLSRQLTSISNVNFSALDGSGKHLKDLASGLSAISGLQNISVPKIDTKNINSVTKAIEKLGKVDSSNAQQTINSIQKVAHSMSVLNTVDFSGSKVIQGINAVKRLMEVKTDNFDTTTLDKIANSMKSFSDLPDVSSSTNRFVSSLQKLVNAGDKARQVEAALPGLGKQLKSVIKTLSRVGDVSEPTNLFVQSIGRLASAGNKTSQTAGQLQNLAQETKKFFKVMENAPKISENTIRMTEALAKLANAGGKVNSATNSITNAFSRLSSVANGLGNIGRKVASMIGAAGSSLSSFGNAVVQTGKKTGSLASQLTSLYAKFFTVTRGIKALWNSVESASDYVETLNYFNSAFEQVTDGLDVSKWKDAGVNSAEEYVGSFEKRAKELTKKMTGFEVSDSGDLTRTKTASLGLDPNQTMNYQATYAQMASSMGATADTATKLSQALTEIGADLASVKNLDFEDVWKDMASGMTGMSRALDKYGINIRVANLQQELYNLGIDTTVSKLSQTDKAILRTITVLNSTKYAWGDLANTINQPANQLRLLQSNFSALSRTIGSLFIPIITKVLPYLNALVIAVQRAFSWVGKLLGINLSDYTASTGSAAIDMDDIADSTEDAASGLDSANNNAKKLKKTLSVLSFDELNQLNDAKTTKTKSSSGSGGGSAHLPELDAALDKALSEYQAAWDKAFEEMNNKANKMADAIVNAFKKKDWKGLGITVADMINVGMQKIYDVINWKKVGPKITEFTDAFTRAFNSLNTRLDFDLLGRTIGAGINTAVNTLNQLIGDGGIDFGLIGSNIGDGLIGALDEIDWNNLGELLGNKFMISWKMLSGFVKRMSEEDGACVTGWDKLGSSLGNALNGAVSKISMKDIADSLSGILNGAFKSLSAFTKTVNWDDLTNNITEGISTFLKNTNWKENGQALGDFISHLCTALKESLTTDTFYEFGQGVGTFLGELPWGEILSTAADLILGGLSSAFNGLVDGIKENHPLVGSIVDILGKAFLAVNILNISGIGKLVGKLIEHIGEKIIAEKNAELIAEKLAGLLGDGTSGAADAIKDLGEAAGSSSGKFGSLAKALGPLVGEAGLIVAVGVAATNATSELAGFVETMQGGNGIGTTFGNTMNNFIQTLQRRGDILSGSAEEIWQLKESLEQEGMTAEDKAKATQQLIDKLGEMGVTSDQAERAFASLYQQQLISEDMFNVLSGAIKNLDDTTTNIAGSIDLSKHSVDDLAGVLPKLTTQLNLSADQQTALDTALYDMPNASGTAQGAFENVMAVAKEMGLNTESVAKIFAEVFPDAVKEMETQTKTSIGNANSFVKTGMGTMSAAAGTAMSGIQKATETAMSASQKNVKSATDNISSDSQTNWGLASGFATGALGEIDQEAYDTMKKVYGVVSRWNTSIKDSFDTDWGNGKDRALYAVDGLQTGLNQKLPGIENSISSLAGAIKNNLSGMYSIGQSAAQSLADGMKSVHLPTLTYYISEWRRHDLGGGKTSSTPVYKPNWYAKGGLFNGAQVIGIGEAGSEAVLPLENPRTMKKIADSIVSSSDGSMGLTKEEMAKAVAQGVAMAMGMNSGNKNPQYIMNSIILDGSEIAKAVTKAQNDTDSRFKPSPAY